MGHDSENLLGLAELSAYRGAILSPVNYSLEQVRTQIRAARRRSEFDAIFDPQLYRPQSDRGCLREWEYFPSDFDTADLSSPSWWKSLVDTLVKCCEAVDSNAICSPAAIPRVFSDSYYKTLVAAWEILRDTVGDRRIRAIQSAVVSVTDMGTPGRAQEIASILSQSEADELYLVFSGSLNPRQELNDPEEITGLLRLIASIEASDMRVIVSHCSSDMLLWKAAGATSCATGKFFNLRRFTLSRFEEPAGGGGQLPYFFEEQLVGFLRESDILRVLPKGMIDEVSRANPFTDPILKRIESGEAWLALAWRQYLYWFADAEARVQTGALNVGTLLREAERRWLELEDSNVLMEERRNDGSWLRPWRRALVEYSST
jgi:hypothetical protein